MEITNEAVLKPLFLVMGQASSAFAQVCMGLHGLDTKEISSSSPVFRERGWDSERPSSTL
jgi:hypothetical protein